MRNLEDLETKLSRSLSWRKKEMVGLILAAQSSDVNAAAIRRAAAVIFCSHWEGFLRDSINSYVEYVFSRRLGYKNLTSEFVAIALHGHVKSAADAKFPGAEQRKKFAELIVAAMDGEIPVKTWEASTESNPSSEITIKLLTSVGLDRQLGLDEAAWSIAKVFLDSQLLKDRHAIAHGEGFQIAEDTLSDRSHRVLDLCERLTVLILRAADLEQYRRPERSTAQR
jgi:hypothetical protein